MTFKPISAAADKIVERLTTQAYSDPRRASDPHALPDVEVFYVCDDEARQNAELEQAGYGSCPAPGYYWWACFPGCLPDSDPVGPFATKAEALADAQSSAEDDNDLAETFGQ